jgi:glycosyltransferase involved in cell wall biosynthesis
MRVLIFSQYFPPENTAGAVRNYSFASALAERGHEVHVVAGVPNHPQGVVHPEYRGRPVHRREVDGFTVWRVWNWASPKKNLFNRVANYGSYAAAATVAGVLLPRPDVVFASSPPLPVGAAAAAAALRHRAPWVLDVRDLWPDAAVAMGELSNPRVVRLLEWLERGLYERADAVTTVTAPFERTIAERGAANGKVTLLPNGAGAIWLDAAALEPDRAALGLPEDKFVWTFAGHVGKAQGLDSAVEAAGLLGDRFRLLVLGIGPARAGLEQLATRLPAGSVEFRDQVPPAEAVPYLRASDALLVSLDANPCFRSFVPSKLFDCCAVARPVVVAAAGEAQRLVEENDAGLGVAPADAPALADALRRLADDEPLRRRLSEAGHRFASASSREAQSQRLCKLLEGLAGA